MSSSPEILTRTTGAHRAHREARDRAATGTPAQCHPGQPCPPVPFDAYLDGLFTYCLSVLCDHDTAIAALADALALARRRRGPDAPDDRRARLYALARWACLRKLAEAEQKRQGLHAPGRHGTDERHSAKPPALPEEVQDHRRRELALLAWPEAAGTTPEQREALELAVRHQLAAHEVAAVLRLASARDLLASAACEVERTRVALAVVETGTCPSVARLTGDHPFVLGAALRRELVRHVDHCPHCRRTAERAVPGRWPGTTVTPAALPVVEAPRAAVHLAMAHLTRARGGAPRFDRRGFPMDPKDRAARRDRLRARAVTTTVVATVVAAPVLALWAAYRGAPLTGEGTDGSSASAREAEDSGGLGAGGAEAYENAGSARSEPDPRQGRGGKGEPDVTAEVIGAGEGADGLRVSAAGSGDVTSITLTVSGKSAVRWAVRTGADWLYPSRSSGILGPGDSVTVKVYVDPLREPAGDWSARVQVAPAGAVVSIRGHGTAPAPVDPLPTPRGTQPTATLPGGDPTSTQTPPGNEPTPTPAASDPGDPDPGTSTPPGETPPAS